MNQMFQYKAAIYLRISREDEKKCDFAIKESNSILNQKKLLEDYVRLKSDIKICSEKVDDGFSGIDFERPAFRTMIREIMDGEINCILVKDLSRFGRNYIEVGRYIEQIFPKLGVRFIAVNDHYDSFMSCQTMNELIVPFKNIMNDAYSYDISMKIRSQLEIKQKKGDYIGAFSPFAYEKSEENKNQLVIDPYGKGIVESIFLWKIKGLSNEAIANKLNSLGILTPYEYKKSKHHLFESGFKKYIQPKWTKVAIGRILGNEVYIGNLQQGKRCTPNCKVKTRKKKSKEDWIFAYNTHEAIVDQDIFLMARRLCALNLRTSPSKQGVSLFSGLLICNDCRTHLIRKTTRGDHKDNIYFVCSFNKSKRVCSPHRISEKILYMSVLKFVENIVNCALDYSSISLYIEELQLEPAYIEKSNNWIIKKEEEISYIRQVSQCLEDDLCKGILDQEEYNTFTKQYQNKLEEVNIHREYLLKEQEETLTVIRKKMLDLTYLIEKKQIVKLDRNLLLFLIEYVIVYEGNRIELKLSFRDFITNVTK